ncbi:MAG: hypothetical protein IH845_01930 [Nanoarchaeota archaeon]|nr:hypothetical protein [Nanoarchaeota archaeon]
MNTRKRSLIIGGISGAVGGALGAVSGSSSWIVVAIVSGVFAVFTAWSIHGVLR